METEVRKHNAFPWNFFPILLHHWKHFCVDLKKTARLLILFLVEKTFTPNDGKGFLQKNVWIFLSVLWKNGHTNVLLKHFLGWEYSLWVSPDVSFSTSHVHWRICCKDHNSLHQCPNRHPNRLWAYYPPWFLKHLEHRHRKSLGLGTYGFASPYLKGFARPVYK